MRAEEMARATSLEIGAPIGMNLTSQVGASSWHMDGFLEAFEIAPLSGTLFSVVVHDSL